MDHLFDAAFDIIPIGGLTKRAVVTSGRAMRAAAAKGSSRAVRKGSSEERATLVAYLDRRSVLA